MCGSTGEHEQQQIRRGGGGGGGLIEGCVRGGGGVFLPLCCSAMAQWWREGRRAAGTGEWEEGRWKQFNVHMNGHWPGWKFAYRPFGFVLHGRRKWRTEDAIVEGTELQNYNQSINSRLHDIPVAASS